MLLFLRPAKILTKQGTVGHPNLGDTLFIKTAERKGCPQFPLNGEGNERRIQKEKVKQT